MLRHTKLDTGKDVGEGLRIEANVKTEKGVLDVVLKSETFYVRHLNIFNDPYLGGGFTDCRSAMEIGSLRPELRIISLPTVLTVQKL